MEVASNGFCGAFSRCIAQVIAHSIQMQRIHEVLVGHAHRLGIARQENLLFGDLLEKIRSRLGSKAQCQENKI
ncbi:MAG: hypothetical protein IPN76_13830 [Saprospiraceae bacterium]|nr:hypothetical protein [Saprospiraceae bacterium]